MSVYLTLAQLDLLGSARTGASSLDRLVTIPRIMFSMRVKTSCLEIKRDSEDDDISKIKVTEEYNRQ